MAGSSNAVKAAIMVITTSSSTNVKPRTADLRCWADTLHLRSEECSRIADSPADRLRRRLNAVAAIETRLLQLSGKTPNNASDFPGIFDPSSLRNSPKLLPLIRLQ